MTTPTPANKASALSQAVATPPVSTPFSTSYAHLAFSPHGPKSLQHSPQHVKKSPANSNTLYGYPAAGNHPTNSSFGVGYDSPSAALALGSGALGDLGIDGLGTPGASGLAAIGLGGGGGARGDEQDRARRLGVVMDILKANKGRLSEAGMERLASRLGLECLWETNMQSSASTMRTLIIAGSAVALEIDFSHNVVQKVAISFPDCSESVTRHTDLAGQILMQDLHIGEKESPLTKSLGKFAANLGRLAALDRLSVVPELNLHEAVAGLYESLERLHVWEMKRLKESEEDKGKADEQMEVVTLCGKSGRPLMHARDRLGLSLDYWTEKRLLPKLSREGTDVKIWSLLVECAPLPGLGLYAPLRVSKDWISAHVQKANPSAEEAFLAPDTSPVLDWQEPENTFLPSTEPPKQESGPDITPPTQKFPEVMFVAKFDPPVIVPYSLAASIFNSTSAPIDMFQTSTFDGLLFPPAVDEKIEQGEPRTIKRSILVPVFKDGEKVAVEHSNTLMIDKIDYGRTLTEIPFSHPNQLVGMLPVLRQYAFLSTLLGKSFGSAAKVVPAKKAETTTKEQNTSQKLSLKDFMSQKPVSATKDRILSLDVTFTTQPNPRLVVVFPFRNRTANITFEINLNGAVQVTSQNILDKDGQNEIDGKKKLEVQDLAKMLEITEDLGVWAEFVRRRLE